MAPVTEISILPIASTSSLTDTSTKEGEIWATSEETVRAANGAQSLYWSRWVENKEIVHLMISKLLQLRCLPPKLPSATTTS